jgi:AcrR family transcriptional regulator
MQRSKASATARTKAAGSARSGTRKAPPAARARAGTSGAAASSRSATTPGRPKGTAKPPRKEEVKRRVRLETDERRAQLLALAQRVFTERAYDDVSIDDIAEAAGISKGLLYHYFPTKRDLYVAGLRATANELVISVTAVIDNSQPPAERVRAALHAYLTHVVGVGPGFVALMRGGVGSDPQVVSVVEATRRVFLDQILVHSPLAQAFAADPLLRLSVRGWIGMVEATSIEWVGNQTVELARLRDMLVDNILSVVANARTAAMASYPRG